MSSPLAPTYRGHVASTRDALILFEACLQGQLYHVARPPKSSERAALAKSGNIFIYEEHSSGIKDWADGIEWSSPQSVGNFWLYRKLAHSSSKSKSKSNGTYDSKGLCKTVMSVVVNGITHNLVAYFAIRDVMASNLSIPSMDQELYYLVPRDKLVDQGFQAPLDDEEVTEFVKAAEI